MPSRADSSAVRNWEEDLYTTGFANRFIILPAAAVGAAANVYLNAHEINLDTAQGVNNVLTDAAVGAVGVSPLAAAVTLTLVSGVWAGNKINEAITRRPVPTGDYVPGLLGLTTAFTSALGAVAAAGPTHDFQAAATFGIAPLAIYAGVKTVQGAASFGKRVLGL